MGEHSIIPPQAFDIFLDELDPKEIVEIVKLFSRMSDRVFLGFRPCTQAIKNPVVRQRLAKEFETNRDFMGILLDYWLDIREPLLQHTGNMNRQELSEEIPDIIRAVGGLNTYLALLFDRRKTVKKLAERFDIETLLTPRHEFDMPPDGESSPPAGDDSKKLKAAKDKASQLQKENRRLTDEVKSLNKTLVKSENHASALSAEIAELKRKQSDLRKKADHAARDRDKALIRVDELDRKVNELRKALDAKPERPSDPPSAPWQDAVKQLLKMKQYQSAADFLTALIERTADDPHPHELLYQTYRLSSQKELQVGELVWLGKHYLDIRYLATALDRLSRALILNPKLQEVRGPLRSVFSRTDIKNEKRVSDLRKLILRLRQSNPDVCAQVLKLADEVAPALAKILGQSPKESYADRVFTLESGGRSRVVSPRQIVDAINRNDTELVAFIRASLKILCSSKQKTFDALDHGIRECDDSCCTVLYEPTEPVVVDASNVVHNFKSPGDKPRVRNLVMLRREIRRKGYFPIYMIGDAPLPHIVDHQPQIHAMIAMGELELTDPKTDADGPIIELAKRLNCPIVTNDRMIDWDPTGEVTKIQYIIEQDEAVV